MDTARAYLVEKIHRNLPTKYFVDVFIYICQFSSNVH